jgi:hypothetical protein
MICQAMEGKQLCTYDGIRTIRGGKRLCIIHIDSFFRGEQIKWAPKRLLSYEIERRASAAAERYRISMLNEEYYVRNIR